MKKLIALFLCGALLVPTVGTSAAKKDILNLGMLQSERIKNEYVEGEVLVEFKSSGARLMAFDSVDLKAKKLERKHKLKAKRIMKSKNIAVFEKKGANTKQLIKDLQKERDVKSAQPNYIYSASAQTTYWNIGNGNYSGVNADQVWNTTTGSGVTVAIIDSGIDYDHADLLANHWINTGETSCSDGIDNDGNGFIDDCHGWDFIGSSYLTPTPDNDPNDFYGHGTHVAGTVAAVNNTVGLVGVAPDTKLMAIKALDDNGDGTTAMVIDAINYAKDNGADIVNMSLGGTINDPLLEAAINNAVSSGLVMVAAAGNAGGSANETTPHYPAAYPNVIGVGAIDSNNQIANFSSRGSWMDVVAPGVLIASTYPEHLTPVDYLPYAYIDGTSMASPHVAGIAALILQQDSGLTPAQVRDRIINNAVDLGAPGQDNVYGYGAVEALNIVHGKAASNELVINELAWAGSETSTGDEWIELKNLRSTPINLTGYQLTRNDGSEAVMVTIPAKILPANGIFLVANNSESEVFAGGESVLDITPDVIDASVALSNTALQVKLYNGNFSTAGLVDTAGDGATPLAGSNGTPKATMSRKSVPGDGTLAQNWFTSTLQGVNYDVTATDLGSPKEANEADPDTTPPVRSNGLPTGTLTAGTTTADLSLTTDENATCKFDTTASTDYASMTGSFTTTGTTTHSESLTGLTDGTSYTYYVRCQDTATNANSDDFTITFAVATPADTTPPVRSNGLPTGTLTAGTTTADLSLTTDENATCKFDTTASTDYASMTGSFTTTGTTTHSESLTGLTDGTSYTYYVRCQDTATNANSDDFTITFAVATPADTTPPVRSNGLPTGTLTAGTTTADLSLTTDENATCKFDTTASTDYASMTGSFTTTGTTTHSESLTGLTDGTSYTYYVRCQDTATNANSDDFTITFAVATPADTTPPVRSNGLPTGTLTAGTTTADLSLTTDENATCKFDTTASTDYASMTGSFTTTGTTTHSESLTGLTDGTSYTYYVRCQDTATNANSDDFTITFAVATPPVSTGNIDDLFMDRVGGSRWYIAPTNSNASGFSYSNKGTWTDDYEVYPGDFNADGQADLFIRNKVTGEWQFAITNSTGTDFTYSTPKTWPVAYKITVGDFDGNGQSDLFLQDPVTTDWKLAITNSTTDDFSYPTDSSWTYSYNVTAGDFNGDGRDDLFMQRIGSKVWVIAQTNAAGSNFSYSFGSWIHDYNVTAGDFNGDGRDDLFMQRIGSKVWVIAQTNAAGSNFSYSFGSWIHDYNVTAGDFNGDGRDDLFMQRIGTKVWIISLMNNSASGFSYNFGSWLYDYEVYVGDFDGQ